MPNILLLICVLCLVLTIQIKGEKGKRRKIDRLTAIYLEYNATEGFDHWLNYAAHYHHHISHLSSRNDNIPIQMLEIGVQSGGSTRIWSKYFGRNLNYTGLDINPNCAAFESPALGVQIRIGSQLNATFLQDICTKFGPFDFIIDDGGHTTEMIITSFRLLWPSCMKDDGVYAIEDLHSMFLFDGPQMLVDGMHVFGHLASWMRTMSSYFTSMNPKFRFELTDPIVKHIASISIYDSLAILHYQEQWKSLTRISKGKFIPFYAS